VLPLEREKVVFMPLHWTIVHPIDKSSPLHGKTEQEFNDSDPEILIQVKGVDETFAQTVHARSSYKHFEVVWGAKFADMYLPPEDGWVSVDMKKLHEIEPAAIDD
jgi:inward rectifier potassium channel